MIHENRVSFDFNSIGKWFELFLFLFRPPTLTCCEKKSVKQKIKKNDGLIQNLLFHQLFTDRCLYKFRVGYLCSNVNTCFKVQLELQIINK